MSEAAFCKLCGGPMPAGEEMFHYHGFSGPCPNLPLVKPSGIEPEAKRVRQMSDEQPDRWPHTMPAGVYIVERWEENGERWAGVGLQFIITGRNPPNLRTAVCVREDDQHFGASDEELIKHCKPLIDEWEREKRREHAESQGNESRG